MQCQGSLGWAGYQASGGIGTLQSRASGLQSTTQGHSIWTTKSYNHRYYISQGSPCPPPLTPSTPMAAPVGNVLPVGHVDSEDEFRRNALTSTFEEAATEKAYLKSRLPAMHAGIYFCCVLLGSVLLLLGMHQIMGRLLEPGRTYMERGWFNLAASVLLFLLAGAMRMSSVKRLLRFQVCEGVVMVMYIAVAALHVPPGGIDHNANPQCELEPQMCEYSYVLALDAIVTCMHLVLPVRWKVIVWGDLLYVICLIVRGCLMPVPYRDYYYYYY